MAVPRVLVMSRQSVGVTLIKKVLRLSLKALPNRSDQVRRKMKEEEGIIVTHHLSVVVATGLCPYMPSLYLPFHSEPFAPDRLEEEPMLGRGPLNPSSLYVPISQVAEIRECIQGACTQLELSGCGSPDSLPSS